MVFCCIAIVAIAIIYFVTLWIRQLFYWPRKDLAASTLPTPPRALSGNGALPVYGHTRLFTRLGGDVALLFPDNWLEVSCLPARYSRRLGDCFSVFIWGQWRVVIKGPERAEAILNSMELKDSWPWTPPITLLGKACFAFMEQEEVEQLRRLIARPLAQRSVLEYAPEFAELAEKCLDECRSGKFGRRRKQNSGRGASMDEGSDDESVSLGGEMTEFKVKWEALRSYTFDIVDGPILNMNKWGRISEQAEGQCTGQEKSSPRKKNKKSKEESLPSRERMLLFMERMKRGLDVIKMTYGPEWMYIWMMNEYGRALNARLHVEKIIAKHVKTVSEAVPVSHEPGHTYRDPTTQPIPLLTIRENLLRDKEGIFGGARKKAGIHSRPRSQSMPANLFSSNSDDELDVGYDSKADYARTFTTEQDLAVPNYSKSPALMKERAGLISPMINATRRVLFPDNDCKPHSVPLSVRKNVKTGVMPLLEKLLRQEDADGNGMSQAVASELSITLWMMLEVGNAWTAMALHLLSSDSVACVVVQDEIEKLEEEFGHDKLFTSNVLKRMKYLDALIYESIRLCPAFLGGLKETTQTVEFQKAGVQIPRGSHIFFCQPTTQKFDIREALGQKPETLGVEYPSVELYGYLPFQGLEVPLMVLQTKVFLIAALHKFSPYVTKKKTFIRRVKNVKCKVGEQLNKSFNGMMCKTPDRSEIMDSEGCGDEVPSSPPYSQVDLEMGVTNTTTTSTSCGFTQRDANRLFTKIPFPEPRRVIRLRPRSL